MTKNRADLDKHRAACTECDQPFNKTQTDPDLCQHKTTSSRRVSTEPKRATRNQLYASTNIPISRSKKNNRTTNLNISSDQVDSLAVSGIDNNEPKQDKEVVIIDSNFSYEDYADSDTDTELTPAKEDQKESTKCTPSYKVDSLLNYTDDDFQNGTGSIASCPSDASTVENENYYTRLKEPQTESSTQEMLAGLENVEVVVRDEEWAARNNMNAFLSVAKGSTEPLRFMEI
ncbi:hypothetical protein INT48_005373, partial [Thamnidium elegans]